MSVTRAPVQLTFDRLLVGAGNASVTAAAKRAPARCCRCRLRSPFVPGLWPSDGVDTPPPVETKTAVFQFFCRRVEMRVRRWPDRLRLDLRADHEDRVPSRFELDLRLLPRLSLRVRNRKGWASRRWSLAAGLPWLAEEPFEAARQWVFAALAPRNPHGEWGERHAKHGDLSGTMQAARAAIRQAAVSAAALLDPEARKIALRFPNHLRGWLYGRLVKDGSGRLAQLASVCPGALTFAFALSVPGRRAGTRAAGAKLLRDVVAGRGLNEALDAALASWAAGAARLVEHASLREAQRAIWRRLVDAGPRELRSIVGAQRLLIRRAGAGVPSYTLWVPPPLRFAPEDIPEKKLANARWFRLVKGHGITLAPPSRNDPDIGEEFAAFVSRHAAALADHWKPHYQPRWRIQEMLDYAVATHDFPRRNTSPARYLEAVDRWHAGLAQLQELVDAADEVGQPLVDADGKPLAFPEPPCPGWHSGADQILPLRTAEEVLAEGNKMHNCVLSRVPRVLAGAAALYHGEIGGKGLTIQIESSPWGYRLVEAKGIANKALDLAQKRVLGEFLRHFGKAARCGCGQAKNA